MNIKIDRDNCIGKKVVLSKAGYDVRIPEMRKWEGIIYHYDPVYDRFHVCWDSGQERHHFQEHPTFIALKC